MTKLNRLQILCIEKLSWRFYQNRMKNGRAVVLTSQIAKFPVLPPKNHRTMTKMNRLHILCIEKLSWRFYQNRMKNGRAKVLTRNVNRQTDGHYDYNSKNLVRSQVNETAQQISRLSHWDDQPAQSINPKRSAGNWQFEQNETCVYFCAIKS